MHKQNVPVDSLTPPTKRKGFPWGIVVTILGVASAVVVVFLLKTEEQSGPPVTTAGGLRVAEAEKRDLAFALKLSGDVAPAFEIDVKAEVGGKVKHILTEVNQQVERNQLLVEIDDADLLTEMAAAETEFAGAQLNLSKATRAVERAEQLRDRDLLSAEDFENLQIDEKISANTLERAQRRIEQVEERLSKTKIGAPADGLVLQVNIVQGQVVVEAASVNAGTTLLRMADLTNLIVRSHINQVDVALIGPGKHVKLMLPALPGIEMTGQITFIAPIATVQNNIKGFAMETALLDPHERLRPGMTVDMEIVVEEAQEAVSIPIAAVFRNLSNSKVVFVQQEDGGFEERQVETGVSDLFHVEITSGLEDGEVVSLINPRLLEDDAS
ncbi:MAG: efflux RND transporter periplasmic adaptor subunit [Verrucomicrobiales bacterium]